MKQGYTQQLFIAGYSQGGFVALATQRAIQQQYSNEFKVTAAAGLSGPYALAQFSDNVFSGSPNAGITVYLPLIATSAQRAGAAIYGTPQDLYESQYAAGIESLLPGSMLDLINSKQLSQKPFPKTLAKATSIFSMAAKCKHTGSV